MKKLMTICLALTMILAISGAVNADWDIGQPAKWVQLPDKEPTGIDVNAMTRLILADDFLCTETANIDDIHIWGSWKDDHVPTTAAGGPDPTNMSFRLSIYSDIPAELSPTDYSMPDKLLKYWDFTPGTFTARKYLTDVDEGWLNPPSQYYENSDSVIWQYNFSMKDDPFEQKGTSDSPVVYWLAVSAAVPDDPNAFFGWKTSIDHWNDDAVFSADGAGWQELIYPDGHEYEGKSIDLAFVITPEPTTIALLGLGSLTLIRRKRYV